MIAGFKRRLKTRSTDDVLRHLDSKLIDGQMTVAATTENPLVGYGILMSKQKLRCLMEYTGLLNCRRLLNDEVRIFCLTTLVEVFINN